MTDLVDRLREAYSDSSNLTFKLAADEIERQQQVIANMMIDAHVSADEIERLRAQIVASENLCLASAGEIDRLRGEVRRLQEALARAALGEPKP